MATVKISASEKPAVKGLDYYAIILDESGSMSPHRADTIGSLRQFYINQQEISKAISKFRITTFSNKCEMRLDTELGKQLEFKYNPNGSTALYDAIGMTIQSTLNYLAKTSEKPNNVYIIILTDGEENASTTYNKKMIKTMIEEQKAADWNFIFLGANQDAVLSGSDIGIESDACLEYNQNSHATANVAKCLSSNIMRQQAFSAANPFEKCRIKFSSYDRSAAKI